MEEGREQLRKHQSCARQIEQMTERISHYEMRVISLTLNRSKHALADYPPPSEVFENKLIYDLKKQNLALSQQNQALIQELSAASPSFNRPPSSQPTEPPNIKARLDQFSSNLESAIGGGLKRVRSV